MNGLINLINNFVSMPMLFCLVIELHLGFRAPLRYDIFCEAVLIFILSLLSTLKMIKFMIFFPICRYFCGIFLCLGLMICNSCCLILMSMFIDFSHVIEIE